MIVLRCDPCNKPPYNHDGCARYVEAFIEPSGPDRYVCECSCNRQRNEREDADRKVRQVLDAYRKRYGAEATAAAVSVYSGGSSAARPVPTPSEGPE